MKRFIYSFVFTVFFCTSWIDGATPTLHKYRVYCITEAQNVYTWREEGDAPTVCPNDPAHTINPNSISVLEEVSPNNLLIAQEKTITGGNYRLETYRHSINAGPNVITTGQLSWPINISLIALKFFTTIDHESDIFRIYEKSDVGSVTADVTPADTVIAVDQAVIDALAIGYHVELDDGTNIDDLGRVIAIDTTNNTITVEKAAVNSFLASQSPVVRVFKKLVEKYEIGPAGKYTLLENRSVAQYLTANTILYIEYKNKSSTAKKLVFECEYLY